MKMPKEIQHRQRKERAQRRQEIGELLSQVRTLQQAVGRAQYERGVISKGLRWELEEALSSVEHQLWSEWKNPDISSDIPSQRDTKESWLAGEDRLITSPLADT